MIKFKTALYDQICHTAAFSCVLVSAFSLLAYLGLMPVNAYNSYSGFSFAVTFCISIIVGAKLRQHFAYLFYPNSD